MNRPPIWPVLPLLLLWLASCAAPPPPAASAPSSPLPAALSAASMTGTLIDELADLSQTFDSAGLAGLRLVTVDPQNFGGDGTRLGKRGVGPGRFVSYHSATDLTRVGVTASFNGAEPPDDLLFSAAGNDLVYTPLSVPRPPLVFRGAGWSVGNYEAALPPGTRFVRIEFGPNSRQDWTVQLSQVRLEGYRAPGFATDDLNDFSRSYDPTTATLRLDTATPANFGGDPSRLSKRGLGAGRYVGYQSSTDLAGFEVTAYFNSAEAPVDLVFSASADGQTFAPVSAARSPLTFITAGWSRATYRARLAPGTRFVRVEFGAASQVEWAVQVGQVRLEEATLVTERPLPPPSPEVQAAIAARRNVSALRPTHPRLLATAEDFARLRAGVSSDATLRGWHAKLRTEADALLSQPPSRYELPDGVRLLDVSRRVLSRVSTLGLLYQLDGTPAYAQRAWQELEAAAAFPDWNPDHFLDVAEMTHAFALGYDWLYDALSAEQRATVRNAIINKGLKPGVRVYRGLKEGPANRWFWVNTTINWNLIVNGGLGLGALAIGDEVPELAEEVIVSGLASLKTALGGYQPDGSYREGIGYWGYATHYLVSFLAASRSALDTDHGLIAAHPALARTGDFALYANGPIQAFNYGDVGPARVYEAALSWLSTTFGQPRWGAYQRQTPTPTAQDLIWYAPGATSLSGAPLDGFFDDVDVATMRGAWDKPGTLFTGLKAGGNQDGHNDLDLGSFALDALGVRWAEELGQDSYVLPGFFEYGATGRRWDYYRKRAEGQNTLVINPGQGPDQDPLARADIVARGSSPQNAFAVADLSAAYARDATSVRRGLAVLDERRAVLLQDEVQTRSPAELYWFMHSYASIELLDGGRSALLSRGSAKRLWVTLLAAPDDAAFTVQDAVPLPGTPNPAGQNPNTGLKKLTVHLREVSSLKLAVLFVPLQAGEPVPGAAPRGLEAAPLSEWQAASSERARLSDLKVNGASLPGFSPETFSYDVEVPAGSKVPNVRGVSSGPRSFVLPARASAVPGTTRLIAVAVARPFEMASYTVHFSTSRGTPVEQLPALEVQAVSASGADGANIPQNTLDGRLDTRWSAFGNGQWIGYDLGRTRTLGYLELAVFNGDSRKAYFDVQVSGDGVTWTTVFGGESSGQTQDLEAYALPNTPARYVRLVGYGSSVNLWNSVTEVVLHGQ